jgi:GTPase SAR1 family protein
MDAFIIMFAVSDRRTFECVESDIKAIRSVKTNAKVYLVGNKSDLKREVTREEAEELALREGMEYF